MGLIKTFPASGAGFPSVEGNIPSFPPAAAALNPYWPFSDIALPPFLWRPDLTGDYRNMGSAGAALDLSLALGMPPPSFSNGCVLSSPGGNSTVLLTSPNPDVSDLGAVCSWIFKVKVPSGSQTIDSNYMADNSGGVAFFLFDGQPFNINLYQDSNSILAKIGTAICQAGVEYIIVLTFGNGTLHLHINGVEDTPLVDNGSIGTVTRIGATIYGWTIGDDANSAPSYGSDTSSGGSVIKIEAVAKGIEYTPAQAAEITAGLS